MSEYLRQILTTLDTFLSHCREHLHPADYTVLLRRLQKDERLAQPWSSPDIVRFHLRKMPSWERVDVVRSVLPLKERRAVADTGRGKA